MRYIFLVLSVFVLCQCEKKPDPVIEREVPQCISDLIDDFKEEIEPCGQQPGASVTSYQFQNQVVYAFDRGICIADGETKVYNGECLQICFLGTIIGITKCMGEDFFENADILTVLWKEE